EHVPIFHGGRATGGVVVLPGGRVPSAGGRGLDGRQVPARASHGGVQPLLATPGARRQTDGRLPWRRPAVPPRHCGQAGRTEDRRPASLEMLLRDATVVKDFPQLQWDEAAEHDCRMLVRLAVAEDLERQQDWTTLALVPAEAVGRAALVARQAGVV